MNITPRSKLIPGKAIRTTPALVEEILGGKTVFLHGCPYDPKTLQKWHLGRLSAAVGFGEAHHAIPNPRLKAR